MKSSERELVPRPFGGSREFLESPETSSSVDGEQMTKDLPSEFVNYLRSLFDILDQENCGFVKIGDIEQYWDAKGTSFSGVLESLKKLSPPDGLLKFEDLCRGLRLAIRSSNTKTNTTASSTRRVDFPKETECTSDSSDDSFRVHAESKETEFTDKQEKYRDKQHKNSREQLDTLPISLSNSNLTRK